MKLAKLEVLAGQGYLRPITGEGGTGRSLGGLWLAELSGARIEEKLIKTIVFL